MLRTQAGRKENERDNVRVAWGCCWRALVTLITVLIVYLPYWHGGSTFVAISTSIDMQHFVHSLLAMVAVPLDWLYSQVAQGANFPVNFMQPSSAANTMLVASGLFIFALIYLYLLGKVRRAPVTIEVLFTCLSAAILGYVVFVAGVFWPWYILWALWIVALRRFDALSVSVLLLSCTALLTYPLLYLDRWPIALYQPLLIFGIPFVYLIVKRRNERNRLAYERRSKTA